MENAESSSIQRKTKDVNSVDIIDGRWLALGDSDFDSYQSDDLLHRVNMKTSNASCVLSPIEVQAKDGRDFGEYAEWGDDRRHDYRGNFSLSGATVRSSLFGWREKYREDWVDGLLGIGRELRDVLWGNKPAMGKLLLFELEALYDATKSDTRPLVVQINLGINDINGGDSLYKEFTSVDSHFSWVDTRTDAINNMVDKMLGAYPNIVIVLWELLDDSVLAAEYSPEQEKRIISHTDHWNSNLQAIAGKHSNVIVFESNTFTHQMIGRESNGTSKDIVIDGIKYIRDFVPGPKAGEKVDNTKYIITRDGHGNTILSALFTREVYRLLNDRFGAGIPQLTPVKINTITCQVDNLTTEEPTLEIPADKTIKHTELPYSIGKIVAYDSHGRNISDSAVAASNRGGALYGDGQVIQLRSPRHGIGAHRITVTVHDANGLVTSKTMHVTIE